MGEVFKCDVIDIYMSHHIFKYRSVLIIYIMSNTPNTVKIL